MPVYRWYTYIGANRASSRHVWNIQKTKRGTFYTAVSKMLTSMVRALLYVNQWTAWQHHTTNQSPHLLTMLTSCLKYRKQSELDLSSSRAPRPYSTSGLQRFTETASFMKNIVHYQILWPDPSTPAHFPSTSVLIHWWRWQKSSRRA